jgi:replicative DNA helicase
MKNIDNLKDCGSERAILGTILRAGKDALIDAESILDSSDFSLPINRAIYTGLQHLSEDPSCENFDTESLKLKIKALGMDSVLSTSKDIEYLELLDSVSFDISNIQMFAYQIKKLSVVRELYNKYNDSLNYISKISGNESLSEILQKAEGSIVDFISGADTSNSLVSLSDNMQAYVQRLIESEVIDQVGIPTGCTLWDEAIGGGLRKGTVSVIGSRSKVGKSWDAMNKARNIAKRYNIPVLYLDSELTESYQRDRLICIDSGCPISLFETRKFKYSRELVDAVKDSAQSLQSIPFKYQSISGMNNSEVMALVKRWLVKVVGFREDGKANDCVVVYDYLKLTSGAELTKVTPEYIILGLIMTDLHNFSIKYGIPILTYVQLNREGIDTEDTSAIAGSDRILWLCSNMSLLKNKDENDISMGNGWENGNKKVVILDTRHGSGLNEGDYINIHASLRPNVNKTEACGHMKEGLLFSQVCTGYREKKNGIQDPNQPGSNKGS